MGKSIRNLSTVTRVGLDLAKRVFHPSASEAFSIDATGAGEDRVRCQASRLEA
jgi:hypothetical protein